MNVDLLRKLLPGEVDEYLVRNEVRTDGRNLQDHRVFQITRAVMGQQQNKKVHKVSSAVKLGQTHILCTLEKARQNCVMLDRAKPVVSLSLTLIKDSSLNLRRDLVEEKEAQIKQSLRVKIERAVQESPSMAIGADEEPYQLSFTFSVVSDDGNLASVLTAGASDLLAQLTDGKAAKVFSCLLLLYSGPPPADESTLTSSHALVVDPSMEETQNLSNNLILVTMIQPAGQSNNQMEVDDYVDPASASAATLMIEKVADALRTCYNCQLATSLLHKRATMTLAQMRQATTLGRSFGERAISAQEAAAAFTSYTLAI